MYSTDPYQPTRRLSVVRTTVLPPSAAPQMRRSVTTSSYTSTPYVSRPLETSVYVSDVKLTSSPLRTYDTTRRSISRSSVTYVQASPTRSVIVGNAPIISTTYTPSTYTSVSYPQRTSYIQTTTPAPLVYTTTTAPTYTTQTYTTAPTYTTVAPAYNQSLFVSPMITQTSINAYAWDLFRKYDVRGTGQLSRTEVCAALNDFCDYVGIIHITDAEKNRLFAALDYNESKTNSFAEFEYMLRLLGGIN